MKNKLNSFFSFVGRNLSLIMAIMWAVITVLSLIVWTPETRAAAIYQMQLFLAWSLIYSMEKPIRSKA